MAQAIQREPAFLRRKQVEIRTVMDALSIAAEGGMAGIAKPMKALGSGVFEVALPFRGNAFRVVYAVQPGDAL